MNDEKSRKLLIEILKEHNDKMLEIFSSTSFFNGPLQATFPVPPEEEPALTLDIMQDAMKLAMEAAPAPPIISITYSEYIKPKISYEELKFIPVYPCQMEIVKIGEEREYDVIVIDEIKMDDTTFPSWDRRPKGIRIVAHPSAREEIEKAFPPG